ncbi:solute carrier family 46 member 3-like isoform X1 [Amphibalanus amphitrite]|uniref:solute carrier family 46 member 3-like isoform X1 n=1 Tax=Amphibalanus amphitrite TaxID=1232801 RepID=UPI001C8FB2B3|nr:solute carrier family 46 member 3-like isoform X1 [Amphibalanus amphitrite]
MAESGDNTVVAGQLRRMLACLASYRVEPLVFTVTLAGTLIMATSQNLLMDRVCSVDLGLNDTVCANITQPEYKEYENHVQTIANRLVLYKNLIELVPGVLFALFMGSWSDMHGRKLPLLLPMAGSVVTCAVYIVFSIVTSMPAKYLLVASVPTALTGGNTIFLMAAFSYVGDITGQENRTARLGVLDVCFLGPLAIGFVVSGAVVQRLGYVPLYCVAGGLNVLVLLYGVFLVPESRSSEDLASAAAATGSVLSKQNICRVVHTCFRPRHGYNRSTMLLAMAGFVIHQMTFSGESNIVLPYVKRVLAWNYAQYSTYVTVVLVVCMFYNLVVLPLLSFVCGIRDSTIGVVCSVMRVVGLALRGVVTTTRLFYGATLLGLPGSLVSVTLRSIISKNVAKEELGVVFSFLAAVESVCSVATSSAFLLLYNAVLEHGPGVVWFIAAGITSPTLIILLVLTARDLSGTPTEINYYTQHQQLPEWQPLLKPLPPTLPLGQGKRQARDKTRATAHYYGHSDFVAFDGVNRHAERL